MPGFLEQGIRRFELAKREGTHGTGLIIYLRYVGDWIEPVPPLPFEQSYSPSRIRVMSSLLLPGDPGFDSPSPASPAIFAGDLVGRILSLDVTVQKRYQCGGFAVSFNNPVGVVTPQAQQKQLRDAMARGILIDITDQKDKGLEVNGTRQDSVTTADTGKRAYISIDPAGALMVVVPKDEEDQVSSSGRNENTRARPRGPQSRSAGFDLV